MIEEFQGQYRWLSNFEPVQIELHGTVYPSVEHAYQSAKNNDPQWKIICAAPDRTTGQIKRLGKTVELAPTWNAEKLKVMLICLMQKFAQEPFLTKLLETDNQIIQEGNMWNDKFWGVCLKTGEGMNHLGRMIMDIRRDILDDRSTEEVHCCICGIDIKHTGNKLFCKEHGKPIKNNNEKKV